MGATRSLAALDLLLESLDGWRISEFDWVGSAGLNELLDKVDDLGLLGVREAPDLIDDFGGGHLGVLTHGGSVSSIVASGGPK